MTNNLSKTFTYLNENGDSIIFTYDNGYLINKPIGIDTIQVSLSTAQGINQVGATVQSKNVQPRAVNITGIIVGDFPTYRKEQLLSIVRPDLAAKLYCDDYFLDVVPTATPTIECKEHFAKFTFAVLAAYPYWQKEEHSAAVLSAVEYKFKVNNCKIGARRTDGEKVGCVLTSDPDYDEDDYTYVYPYKFGLLTTLDFFRVYNTGEVPIPFTITFKANGTVTNPSLRNASTNKYIKVNRTMTAGEQIVIEITHSKTYVTSSVLGDIRGAVSLSSSLFTLSVGENVLKPEADSSAENLEIVIDYAIEKVGVAL